MPSTLPEYALVTLLRQCYIAPRCQASRARSTALLSSRALHTTPRPRHRQVRQLLPAQRNGYHVDTNSFAGLGHTKSARLNDDALEDSKSSLLFAEHRHDAQGREKPERIAIIGGGITGLTAAHYITRELSNAKVTIYEAGNRVGGWLQSEYVDVAGGKVLLEKGPRTLRPGTEAALVTLDMIQELGLKDEMLVSWNSSAAALNRFIYYPDHLVKMPGPGQKISDMLWTVLTEPAFTGLFRSFYEPTRPPRPADIEDESVSSFLTRRAGSPHLGDNLVSAVFHGIYAGDINKLSAKSLLAKLYHFEKVSGSVGEAFFDMRKNRYSWVSTADNDLRKEMAPKVEEMLRALTGASVFSFKGGIGTFTNVLEKSLRGNPNVQFRTNDPITSLEHDLESNSIQIKSASTQKYTRVISTISGKTLSSLSGNRIPILDETPSVTVMVVNLFYTDPTILPEQGFGYLIPRSIPYEQNPECALGVVFDSDAIQGQDTAKGTKVTVMMGGHWWDGFDAYPDEEEGSALAQAVLRRHLKITDKPALVRVSLQKNCIPQYTVGHEARMKQAHQDIKDVFKGKLSVAGNSYTGVGMNDCVRSARDVVVGIKKGESPTGLERFEREGWEKRFAPSMEDSLKEMKRRLERERARAMKGPPGS